MDGGTDAKTHHLHAPEDFAGMRAAGRLAAETLDMITPACPPRRLHRGAGRAVPRFHRRPRRLPAPLDYRGYPSRSAPRSTTSSATASPASGLDDGDILNIDVTVILDGWHGDTRRMYVAGTASTKARNLIDVTYESLMLGVAAVKPGVTLGDVGHVIQNFVERHRFSVVRDFCGHGIGRRFHEPPNVLHFGRPARARCWSRHVLHHRADGECGPAGGEGA